MLGKLFLLFCILKSSNAAGSGDGGAEEKKKQPTDCDSSILCHGSILVTIQLSGIYDNSLEFVNKKLKDSPENIQRKFDELRRTGKFLDTDELERFLDENFETLLPRPGVLKDFKLMNDYESLITDIKYRKFYEDINNLWKELVEFTPKETKDNHEYNSMIYLPNHYIKPSTNSIDLPQSWQSYLIVRGLLSNQMFETAAGIIKNYAELIESKTFSLYSNRVYWSGRSSLPFLALMAQEYIDANPEDNAFLEEILPKVEKDFQWWYQYRRVKVIKNGKEYMMFRYQHVISSPRPEHYKEDNNLCQKFHTLKDRTEFYANLRSLDESAFKMSSRFVRPGKYSDDRLNLDVSNRVPVELNYIFLRTVETLASWYILDVDKHKKYIEIGEEIETANNEVLYDETRGVWFDWDLKKNENDYTYYITNLAPLATIIGDGGVHGKKAAQYLMKENIINKEYEPNYFIIPTSMTKLNIPTEGDYPKGSLLWNILIVDRLRKSKFKPVNKFARSLAQMLIKTIFKEYENNGNLLENYNATEDVAAEDVAAEDVAAEDVAAKSKPTEKTTAGSSAASPGGSSQKTIEISASTLGATIDLLKKFGMEAKHTDYDDFKPRKGNIVNFYQNILEPANKLESSKPSEEDIPTRV